MSAGPRRVRVFEGYIDTRRSASDPARDGVLVQTAGPLPQAVRSWRLGDVDACLFEGAALDAVPFQREHPSRPMPNVGGIVLGHVVEGSVDVVQGHRKVTLDAGDTLFYDVGVPFGLHADAPHRYLVAHIPAPVLDVPERDRQALVTRSLRDYTGAAALGALFGTLVATESAPPPGVGQHMGSAIVACARGVLAEVRGSVLGERSALVFGELTAWLDAHLADSDASTERLAVEHFMSPRSVRRLFADHGTTVSAYVRHRRLEHIRDDLLQPWAENLPVAAVAARWGLREPSVFSRAFARQFGQAPQGYRRDALIR